jgi:baculoviral IAP repeat-containing protein 6
MTISKHHYNSSINSESKTSNQGRMVRLAQEMTSLSSSLPNDSYNAIFVRSYVKRLDVMKALISGAEGTPYANGLFEYDVYLSNEYP